MKTYGQMIVILLTVGLLGVANAGAITTASTTTGYSFNLPSGFGLHNVYVLAIENPPNLVDPPLDMLLPAGATPTSDGFHVTPAGFDVPVGKSSFNLVNYFGNPVNEWAVAGVYTDAQGTDHVVLATNQDLTGLDIGTVLPGSFLPENEAEVLGWLETGLVGEGEENGLVTGTDVALEKADEEVPFGQTAQLFYFSGGQPIVGGSVTANDFGTPVGSGLGGVPEPMTTALCVIGMLALALRLTARHYSCPHPD